MESQNSSRINAGFLAFTVLVLLLGQQIVLPDTMPVETIFHGGGIDEINCTLETYGCDNKPYYQWGWRMLYSNASWIKNDFNLSEDPSIAAHVSGIEISVGWDYGEPNASDVSVMANEMSLISGVVGPGQWSISPENPTRDDLIHFSGPIGVHSNACFAAMAMGGFPTLTIDRVNKTIELWFQPPAPEICLLLWDPVCGLKGSFGPLEAGEWLFFGNIKPYDFYIPFQVGPEPEHLTYEFFFAIETDETIDLVEFLTPSGDTLQIPKQAHTQVGDVETWYYEEAGTCYWEYEAEFDNQDELQDYGDGIYTITVHYANGGQAETTVLFGVPNTGDPIAQPTQEPNLTFPEHNGTATSPLTFMWEDCYDSNATSIWLGLEKQDANEVIDINFPADVNRSGPITLSEGMWEAALSFEHWYDFNNVDGIPVEIGKYSESNYAFTVIPPLYRFWSPVNERHFYTIKEAEKDKIIKIYAHVWTYEGIVYYAFETDSEPNLLPVYRFWSDALTSHFYTISESEKQKVIDNYSDVWTFEGIAFYVHPEGQQPQETNPVYRFWSDTLGFHFYTINETEKNKIIDNYSAIWTYEGVAWYAYE